LYEDYIRMLALFAGLFAPRVWPQVQVLLTGALLARGPRTVTAALRVMGLAGERRFVNYHRVLSRASYSLRAVGRTLLGLLVAAFAPGGAVLFGMDETVERRRGGRIAARGVYRDPVRSSQGHFVKVSGLRWLTVMLLAPVPFAGRVWALPFLTVLMPSERYYQGRRRGAKTQTDWKRQGLLQVRRWLPGRRLVCVGDAAYAALELLGRVTGLADPITMVVRFRLDAALYAPAPPRTPGQRGRPRLKGARLPTLQQVAADPRTRWQAHTLGAWYGERRRRIELVSGTAVWYHCGLPALPLRWVLIRDPRGKFKTQALLCTDLTASPLQVVKWFVQRWQMEVTHREAREHLGVETQRQWSERAIARTTPALFGLYSWVVLLAHGLARRGKVLARQSAWYAKPQPTFGDALAAVRYELWRQPTFHVSRLNRHIAKLPQAIFNRFADALCYST
jgi:hypothetical protein